MSRITLRNKEKVQVHLDGKKLQGYLDLLPGFFPEFGWIPVSGLLGRSGAVSVRTRFVYREGVYVSIYDELYKKEVLP